jgi:hypothetical protein
MTNTTAVKTPKTQARVTVSQSLTYIRDKITVNKALLDELKEEIAYRNLLPGATLLLAARQIKHAPKYDLVVGDYHVILLADEYDAAGGSIDTSGSPGQSGQGGHAGAPGYASATGYSDKPGGVGGNGQPGKAGSNGRSIVSAARGRVPSQRGILVAQSWHDNIDSAATGGRLVGANHGVACERRLGVAVRAGPRSCRFDPTVLGDTTFQSAEATIFEAGDEGSGGPAPELLGAGGGSGVGSDPRNAWV